MSLPVFAEPVLGSSLLRRRAAKSYEERGTKHLVRTAACAALLVGAASALLGPLAISAAAIAPSAGGGTASATTSPTPPASPVVTSPATTSTPASGTPAYYLFQSNGAVLSCGGASLYGSAAGGKLPTPIVAGAATANGSGYWLVSSKGRIYNYGAAANYGSPLHLRLPAPITAFAPTADGGGYWLVTAKGNLFHYGDTRFFGSTVHDSTKANVVAIVPTPSGRGYWIVRADGEVRHFGNAAAVTSLAHPPHPVVAAAADRSGTGLWLLTADGGVHNLGRAGFYSSLVHHHLARPATALAASLGGSGYLIATAFGGIYNFGDATFAGSLAAAPPKRPISVIAISQVLLPPPPPAPTPTPVTTAPTPVSLLPHGQFGYDISNFQCAALASSSLPPVSAISTIEVAGWLDNSDNPCLAGEAAWATGAAAAAGAAGSHYALNIFLNAPSQSAGSVALDGTGPAGTSATLTTTAAQQGCVAYNYGYGGAAADFNYATSVGVSAPLWWLDVENANLSSTPYSDFSNGKYWSDSTALNADTIEGALDALHAAGVTVGIYSSSVQFPLIAGAFVPAGAPIPLWVAGVPWTNPPYTESGLPAPSILAAWCAGTVGYSSTAPTDLFAGGVPWLLQETPGNEPSPYGIDPDYAC